MPFLSNDETDALRVSRMVLCVVGQNTFEPEPVHEAIEQEGFFIERIRDTNITPVHHFDAGSEVRRTLQDAYNNPEQFGEIAQNLARDFSRLHVGSTTDGALFIFEVIPTPQSNEKIYSFVKYDYREALEQREAQEAGASVFRRIVQAFIADKRAIQKSALVRVGPDGVHTPVAAKDRAHPAPDISNYFERFLGISRSLSNRELNSQIKRALLDILQSTQDTFPGVETAVAYRQAQAHLRQRQEISADAVEEALLAATGHPEAEQARETLRNDIDRKLRKHRLAGLHFPPDRQVLQQPPRRRVSTTEGIRLEYPDNGALVQRADRPGGGTVFTIETQRVTEDRLINDKNR